MEQYINGFPKILEPELIDGFQKYDGILKNYIMDGLLDIIDVTNI